LLGAGGFVKPWEAGEVSYDQKIYSMILEVFGVSSKQSMKKHILVEKKLFKNGI
jgi:hypothetical protein